MSDHNTAKVDIDPAETAEWLDALESVIEREGYDRAHFLLEALFDKARRSGTRAPFSPNTAYLNTIPPHLEAKSPGDHEIEHRLRSYVRWNAAMMVLRAGRKGLELGGHISTFASAATLYDVGFNHFWHAPSANHGGDLIYIQGHSAPGIYARAYLLGLLSEEQLDNFRQEVDGKGLSSYPHPWLMPDFWQFPTVSMGLGPIMGIYQARFLKYLECRGLAKTEGRKVWVFCGDGEMDEPESLGAISMAAREKLDNLIFVINCNLQRLDGPVRGNGKIIQELEGDFRGSGWNVIKLIWGSYWDPLLARDKDGLLQRRMEECVDGEYQVFKARDGAYVREHFFGKYPQLKAMVANMTDEDIWRLNRGGHDPHKIYAAYHAAVNHKGQPTVILAKTVKGYGMGPAGEGLNTAHQAKKMDFAALKQMRDRFGIPVPDSRLEEYPYYKPPENSRELEYMRERRAALGGPLPARRRVSVSLPVPARSAFESFFKGTGDREISTTMAFVRILNMLVKDKSIGRHVVPIVPDESRTFGMEGMFRQLGIWSQQGQLYQPVDADQLMFYREAKDGQILQEGINEAGAMSSWIAAATSYSNSNVPMLPFYIFYSMFGIQRVGDLCWAAGDSRARGFLIGGTSGRTTLNGEGLQHEDGHSHVWFSAIPNVRSYDPTFQYELALIIEHGIRRMLEEQVDEYYYVTVMNENYVHPDMPPGIEEDVIRGMYLFREGGKERKKGLRVQLTGSGTIFREVIAAADLLREDWGVESDLWSAPSFNELRRDGIDCERWNLLHPLEPPRVPHVARCLHSRPGPVVAATDYMRIFAEGIRPFIKKTYKVLGTDGFGRSDSRENLRRFFEVNRYYITVAALAALAEDGVIDRKLIAEAITRYGIDPEKPNPTTV
ncbi:MAG: pyruvate dehydrogenase (acetyl-transferring), homodimeric type [Casimicrobiaceae bacterium]|nr:pyruvate dehydrogenase (acetyl-transferring), homodimeric type [Casimicrobiaceae bacterium]MCX8099515.1 pyruvate dehydrogenase (acetyl-transferring), homodimeric type [Casimicrobiaceae bacterium]MDW8312248.1 pyruvate dehydrogenase (acetyl-transferring), homodimeric type [Burkholderiales bacterium]